MSIMLTRNGCCMIQESSSICIARMAASVSKMKIVHLGLAHFTVVMKLNFILCID